MISNSGTFLPDQQGGEAFPTLEILFDGDHYGTVNTALAAHITDFHCKLLIFSVPVDLFVNADIKGHFPLISAFTDPAAAEFSVAVDPCGLIHT